MEEILMPKKVPATMGQTEDYLPGPEIPHPAEKGRTCKNAQENHRAAPSMEEAKAAAHYDELTRKGEGAARFKQGLGFSTTTSSVPFPPKPSSSYSSPFSNFVRASSPSKTEKQAQLETIQAKLRGSRRSPSPDFRSSELQRRSRELDGSSRRRSSSKELRTERDRDRSSRSRDGRRSSRSFSLSEEDGADHGQSRNGKKDNTSRSPRISSYRDSNKRDEHMISAEKKDKFDYPSLIKGYSQMTPAERVKAKMKLQLSQTAAKDSTMVMSSGWERFNFNKDAPLDDDDDEIEVVEDDASLVKEIGNSFRFTAVQAKRKEAIKAAHDEAMFGASEAALIIPECETNKGGDDDDDGSSCVGTEMANNEKQHNNILLSDKVLAMRQGSWRDRVKRFKSGFDS